MTHKRSNQHHEPSEIEKHDDKGKDRLFEGREQHDEADKNSEKIRLARDVQRHKHEVDEQVGDSGSSHTAKRKSCPEVPDDAPCAIDRTGRVARQVSACEV